MKRLQLLCFITPPIVDSAAGITLKELFALAQEVPHRKGNTQLSQEIDFVAYKL